MAPRLTGDHTLTLQQTQDAGQRRRRDAGRFSQLANTERGGHIDDGTNGARSTAAPQRLQHVAARPGVLVIAAGADERPGVLAVIRTLPVVSM